MLIYSHNHLVITQVLEVSFLHLTAAANQITLFDTAYY